MCIVIDVNTFPSVFDQSSERHPHFSAVLNWIIDGKGKIVWGGTKYLSEISRLGKYRRLWIQLGKAGKLVPIDDSLVDSQEREIKELCTDPDFDDPHIVALLSVSGCKLLCSQDARSYPYIQKKALYPKGAKLPKIYCERSSRRASKLLTDANIADICQPCCKLNKEKAIALRN